MRNWRCPVGCNGVPQYGWGCPDDLGPYEPCANAILDDKRTLGIDLETYSSVDLKKAGVYSYTSAPDFEILLFAYAFGDEPVQLVDLASGEKLPPEILAALSNDNVLKTAFNANFERTCLSAYLKQSLSPNAWRCTAVQAAMLGLPLHLAGVAKVLALEEQKMGEGKALIRYFCCPCKPTKVNGGRTRNLPVHAPEKWAVFRDYCKRDVEVEQSIRKKLEKYPISDNEQALWVLDQQINDRGILVDTRLVENAIKCDKQYRMDIFEEAKELTGLDNPNSVAQLKEWLLDSGVEVESLSKKAVAEMESSTEGDIQRLLQLRQEMAKTSIKKYNAIQRAICPDNHVRGLLQFYGANRTGRWAGRLIQVHNLPQNHLPDLETARGIVKDGDFDFLEMVYDSVPGVLSELIRTAFIPSKGHRLIVADFSAIEARVIAWLAGEAWRLEVFNGHGKIYEASASQMFSVPVERITKGNPEYALRQKGKICELALGYQGGANALIAMGALDMGLNEEELDGLVKAWRRANSNIVKYWYAVEDAAKKAVKKRQPSVVGSVKFHVESGILFITLPSGRKLSYIKPKIEINKFGREAISYEGIGESRQWCRIGTYGGRLVENITQAVARDCLADAMLRVDKAGYMIGMHVHDEIVISAPIDKGSLKEACAIMGQPISWAVGLPLKAAGFESVFYKKS
ncbi:DNA polymerase [Candidatus Desulfosporosinus infrequens]|uniref:DNA-directed DNA polymerase n=1 Tax=Candidatus Desulfosporosinus infrequens TaxID=2043169 RepID=A0A2U3KAA2_9FIRM|nr:DNA polymerase [Candidatus Desulfosporosinus infrequens]